VGVVTKPLAFVGALVFVALAFVAARTEPQEEFGFAPFAVRVEQGERGEGRGLQGAVDDARLADVVHLTSWTGTTTGVWLVVDVRMMTTENPSLAYATLRVGDRTWSASTRPGSRAMNSGGLEAGLPIAGSFVFELPAELRDDPHARTATVHLSENSDTRMITVIEVELDLTTLAYEPEFEITPRERFQW
jgi:hypothetical protein